MSISPTTARKFSNRIRRLSKKKSYRQMVREDFPARRDDGSYIVKHGTLNRIATERGQYLPVDKEILIALGLAKPPKPRARMIIDMTCDELLQSLNNRTALIATHTKSAMSDFIRSCNLASRARKARAL